MSLFLLTVILFGMGRVVIKMVYGEKSEEKTQIAQKNISKLNLSMYVPQIIMLTLAFVLGVYVPKFLDIIIKNTIIHELIHCLPKCTNHGKEFKKYAKIINEKLGYNGDYGKCVLPYRP